MDELSVLIGGKAGFGIDKSSLVIGNIFAELGYRLYIYRDYPSLIRGGHTFSIIRAAKDKIAAHKNSIDVLLALNQETLDLHQGKLSKRSVIIYDSDSIKKETLPKEYKTAALPLTNILKEDNLPEIMRNTCAVGAMCKTLDISWEILDLVFRKNFSADDIDSNLKIARRGYDIAEESIRMEPLSQKKLPLFTGNETTALGLVRAGLNAYISYPMTPTSPILHFLAAKASEFSLEVIHPESEIAVIMMAAGFSYCGKKSAVGTSGGGFCLMTEGLSFSAMSELPVVIILGQRPGPSTGLPTYSSQTELGFALNAGQGEFLRFVVAPGDAEEAYYWSQVSLNMSWKYQIPSIILSDKTLGEGTYSFDIESVKNPKIEGPALWDRVTPYKRYLNTETGVSPLAFASDKAAVVKVNSYEHDESGITTEDPKTTVEMQKKRLRKEKYLTDELQKYETVKIHGNKNSPDALLCWGSNKGVCVEAAKRLNIKVIQPLVLSPFPSAQFKTAIKGVKRLVCVENNATSQLAKLLDSNKFKVDEKILKYDGRPFSADELEEEAKGVIK